MLLSHPALGVQSTAEKQYHFYHFYTLSVTLTPAILCKPTKTAHYQIVILSVLFLRYGAQDFAF